MSANNQVLVKEYKGRWYVFNNVMAESWYNPVTNKENELSIEGADGDFNTKEEAYTFANRLETEIDEDNYTGSNTEYGIGERLIKDGKDVKLI